jgi:predicted PurR-regulated permease PerM
LANRKRPRIRWKRVLAGLGLAVVAFLVAAWLLFQHVPSWYRPVEVAPDQVSQVQADLMRTTDALNERMVRADQPFEGFGHRSWL